MAVEEQMDAVFKSSRAEVDPVSGNEVPTGSLPEEVRDDVPAQLSEGEYVVPADVVRYFGVKFFEDLRNAAKSGWSDMESNGRIGGDPVGMEMGGDDIPFDLEELQVVEAAEGAYISGYNEGGIEVPQGYKGGTGAVEIVEYIGPDGQKIFVQFMNGLPLTNIPNGYKRADTVEETVAEQVAEQSTQQQEDDGPEPPKVEPREPIDWNKATIEDYSKYVDQRNSLMGKAVSGGAALFGGPIIGGLASMAMRYQDKRMLAGLDARIGTLDKEDPQRAQLQAIRDSFMETRDTNMDGKLDNIIERSGIFGGEDRMTENLIDSTGDGKSSFGDTWLGDLLGLDGQAGVQGPGLSQSRAGARRRDVNLDRFVKEGTGPQNNNDDDDDPFGWMSTDKDDNRIGGSEKAETDYITSQVSDEEFDWDATDDWFK